MDVNKSVILTYLAQVQNLREQTRLMNCTCAPNPALTAHLFLLIKSMTGRMVSFRGAAIVGTVHVVAYNVQEWNMAGLLKASDLWPPKEIIIKRYQRQFTSLQLPAKGEK